MNHRLWVKGTCTGEGWNLRRRVRIAVHIRAKTKKGYERRYQRTFRSLSLQLPSNRTLLSYMCNLPPSPSAAVVSPGSTDSHRRFSPLTYSHPTFTTTKAIRGSPAKKFGGNHCLSLPTIADKIPQTYPKSLYLLT